jgi:hypothetical protein
MYDPTSPIIDSVSSGLSNGKQTIYLGYESTEVGFEATLVGVPIGTEMNQVQLQYFEEATTRFLSDHLDNAAVFGVQVDDQLATSIENNLRRALLQGGTNEVRGRRAFPYEMKSMDFHRAVNDTFQTDTATYLSLLATEGNAKEYFYDLSAVSTTVDTLFDETATLPPASKRTATSLPSPVMTKQILFGAGAALALCFLVCCRIRRRKAIRDDSIRSIKEEKRASRLKRAIRQLTMKSSNEHDRPKQPPKRLVVAARSSPSATQSPTRNQPKDKVQQRKRSHVTPRSEPPFGGLSHQAGQRTPSTPGSSPSTPRRTIPSDFRSTPSPSRSHSIVISPITSKTPPSLPFQRRSSNPEVRCDHQAGQRTPSTPGSSPSTPRRTIPSDFRSTPSPSRSHSIAISPITSKTPSSLPFQRRSFNSDVRRDPRMRTPNMPAFPDAPRARMSQLRSSDKQVEYYHNRSTMAPVSDVPERRRWSDKQVRYDATRRSPVESIPGGKPVQRRPSNTEERRGSKRVRLPNIPDPPPATPAPTLSRRPESDRNVPYVPKSPSQASIPLASERRRRSDKDVRYDPGTRSSAKSIPIAVTLQ